MGNPIIKVVILVFIAVFFFWLFTGKKPFGKKQQKTKEKKPNKLLLAFLNVFLIVVGYYTRKLIENPDFSIGFTDKEDLNTALNNGVNLIAIVLIVIGFYNLSVILQKTIYSKFIQPKISNLINGQFWKDYQEYKTYLFDTGSRLRLRKEGLLKYSKEQVFRFWMAESYERGFLVGRINDALFFIISCIIFFPLAVILYDNLLAGSEVFANTNGGEDSVRYYWLFLVWVVSRFLFVFTFLVLIRFAYKIWDNYNRSVINNDDLNYDYYRAIDAEGKGNFELAIKHYNELRKRVSKHGSNLGERYNHTVTKSYIENKIAELFKRRKQN